MMGTGLEVQYAELASRERENDATVIEEDSLRGKDCTQGTNDNECKNIVGGALY